MKLRQRDADGMPAPQHQGGAGFADPGDQFRQGQAGFHIAAHRVQDHQQPFDGRVLLNVHQLRDHMFVLGGFLVFRRQRVALDGADHGQAVDGMAALGGFQHPGFLDEILLQAQLRRLLCARRLGLFALLGFHKDLPFHR